MKARTIIGMLLIVAGAWKLANMWELIENDWLWRQPWTIYIAPAALIYLGALVIINSYRRPFCCSWSTETCYIVGHTPLELV